MKALSLTQPWASIIAIGEKEYETRSWSTGYRGPIAIHASKDRRAIKDGFLERFHEDGIGLPLSAATMPYGAIVAVAQMVDCRRTEEIRLGLPRREMLVGDFSGGRYAFRLAQVRRLPVPIPVGGKLGIWDVPDAVTSAVLEQFSADVAAQYAGLVAAK